MVDSGAEWISGVVENRFNERASWATQLCGGKASVDDAGGIFAGGGGRSDRIFDTMSWKLGLLLLLLEEEDREYEDGVMPTMTSNKMIVDDVIFIMVIVLCYTTVLFN